MHAGRAIVLATAIASVLQAEWVGFAQEPGEMPKRLGRARSHPAPTAPQPPPGGSVVPRQPGVAVPPQRGATTPPQPGGVPSPAPEEAPKRLGRKYPAPVARAPAPRPSPGVYVSVVSPQASRVHQHIGRQGMRKRGGAGSELSTSGLNESREPATDEAARLLAR